MQRKCVCHFSTTYFTVPFLHSVLLSFLIFSPCLSLSLRKTWSFILSFSSRDKRCWDSSKCISSSIAKWQLSLRVCVCVRERELFVVNCILSWGKNAQRNIAVVLMTTQLHPSTLKSKTP